MIGFIVSAILAIIGLVLHKRAITKAEDRGFRVATESQRAAADAQRVALSKVAEDLAAQAKANEAAAVDAVPTGRVERSDVERWQIPPRGGKPS